ncbi:MAG: DUF5810 domain-containing protein [Halobacteriota archaeon]
MGYACPVCGTPQRDGEHLANHLAFTAMLRHEGHEAWLDDNVADWADMRPEDLAEMVVPHAEESEYEEVFEDTVHGSDHAGHGHVDHHHHGASGREAFPADEPLDAATQQVVERAKRLTSEMHDDEE